MTIRTTNNTSIRLLNNQYCFADQHISNTIRVQSRWNYSDIHVCVRSIFNFDFSLALAVLFSSYLETISFWSHLYHELWTTRYIYIYIHLPFPLGNLIIHPKHFLYFPFLTQFHGTHGERVDVKWNTRNPLMQEVGYDSQLKHYSYNFNLLLWLCNEALGCLSFQHTISRFWFRRKYNNLCPNWFLTALFRELILESQEIFIL